MFTKTILACLCLIVIALFLAVYFLPQVTHDNNTRATEMEACPGEGCALQAADGLPPDASNQGWSDMNAEPYRDPVHAAIAQPEKLRGYYVREIRQWLGEESKPGDEKPYTCDTFVVDDGKGPLAAHLREHIVEGNTLNHLDVSGLLILTLGEMTASSTTTQTLYTSYPGKGAEIIVSLREHEGKGALPCASPVHVERANVGEIEQYPRSEWREYANGVLGLTLRYPPNLSIEEGGNHIGLSPLHPNDARNQSSIGLAFAFSIQFAPGSARDEATRIREEQSGSPGFAIHETTVGGRSATRIRFIGAYGGEAHILILVPHRDGHLQIRYVDEYEQNALSYPQIVEAIAFSGDYLQY